MFVCVCVCVCIVSSCFCAAYAPQTTLGVAYGYSSQCGLLEQDGHDEERQGKVSLLSNFCDYTLMEGRGEITESHRTDKKNSQMTGGMRAENRSTVFKRKERSGGDKAVWRGGHVPHIIYLPDCQPDLILFNHNALTCFDGAHTHTHTHTHTDSVAQNKKRHT